MLRLQRSKADMPDFEVFTGDLTRTSRKTSEPRGFPGMLSLLWPLECFKMKHRWKVIRGEFSPEREARIRRLVKEAAAVMALHQRIAPTRTEKAP
jgi:hypothetical protein